MNFIERDWTRKRIATIGLQDLVKWAADMIVGDFKVWLPSNLQLRLQQDQDLGWVFLEEYAHEIAVSRLGAALTGKHPKLKAYIDGSRPRRPREVPASVWWDETTGEIRVAHLLADSLEVAPFGAGSLIGLPADIHGKTVYVPRHKALAWIERRRKLKMLYAPMPILKAWYEDVRRSPAPRMPLPILQQRAAQELRMLMSEAQVDELVKGEGRSRGRPPGS